MVTTYHKQRGFTLVEALVAITILIIGVIGPLVVAVSGITDGLYAQNEIAANYLADEALEAVINLRNNSLNDWTENLPLSICPAVPNEADISDANSCGIDVELDAVLGVVRSCQALPCQLVFDRIEGRYADASTVAVPNQVGPVFTRRLFLIPHIDNNSNLDSVQSNLVDLEAVVTVTWANVVNKGTNRSISFATHLYPRQ